MKTFEQLTKEEKHSLIKKGILNGCGAAKGIDFSPYIELIEESFGLGELFDIDLKEKVCYPHDYAYSTKTKLWERILADIKFGYKLNCVLKGYKIKKRVLFSILASSILILKGGKAFKEANKIII